MFTLIILISLAIFFIVGFFVSVLALPLLAAILPIVIAVAVLSFALKLVFGAPLFILAIIIAAIYFSKNKKSK
ncbi:hypothetical protein P8V03_12645 [Clostridium sp. A1-XYC3]|uniref:Uncharacterized protein n=1 Tax=Clostridium tanneri TaxID=3037988 RepID=A0ABU4JVQ2_9CLOT|nr:hypothetical protein [Clostridium sp. A1-XYC3]MDW8801998.1 hypothetical protein [Clostridium sp. A1-XYC3]